MMEAVVILAGAYQLTRCLFSLVDAIEAPPKRKAPLTLADARRASDPQQS